MGVGSAPCELLAPCRRAMTSPPEQLTRVCSHGEQLKSLGLRVGKERRGGGKEPSGGAWWEAIGAAGNTLP